MTVNYFLMVNQLFIMSRTHTVHHLLLDTRNHFLKNKGSPNVSVGIFLVIRERCFWFSEKENKICDLEIQEDQRGLFLQVGILTKSIKFALHGLKEWMSSKKVSIALFRQQMISCKLL